jgi:hypothetical protein
VLNLQIFPPFEKHIFPPSHSNVTAWTLPLVVKVTSSNVYAQLPWVLSELSNAAKFYVQDLLHRLTPNWHQQTN